MKKISSNLTFINKLVLPIFFIFLAGLRLLVFYNAPKTGDFNVSSIFGVLLFLAFALGFSWFFGWRFVNEVYDLGDGLLVKNKKQQIRVKDTEIEKVSLHTWSNLSYATVYLKNPNELGKKFYFATTRNTGFFRNKNPDIENLIQRIQTTS